MTRADKKIFFWLGFGLLLSLSFLLGFAVGDTTWVNRVKASIFQMIQG